MNKTGQLSVYRGCVPVVDAEYDSTSGRPPTETIIRALADAAGVEPVDLPPIYEYVDPEALDALFEGHDGDTDSDTILSFQVDAWNVFVHSDGRIRICDANQRTDPVPVFESTNA
ncbi:HalOD1 output domain-containing protein [Halomicroarcula sp. GCM10025817]|uniref:HalOD1 output domain-containing protein n=1 Tax=Haloarcula TaxID=2237 RepID=UPI0023E81D7D|nr:HalOD1 output domain-containing protein [Halomicroarcula sp. SYNS111]